MTEIKMDAKDFEPLFEQMWNSRHTSYGTKVKLSILDEDGIEIPLKGLTFVVNVVPWWGEEKS